MCGQHLAVRVDVDAFALSLLEEHLKVFEIVAADEDTGTLTGVDRHFGHFGVTIGAGVGGIELRHRLHTVLAGAEGERHQSVDVEIIDSEGGEGFAHEAILVEVFVSQTQGVFQVGGHTLETVDDEFGERTLVGIGFGEHAHFAGFGVVGFAAGAPRHGIGIGYGSEGAETFGEGVAEVETAIHTSGDALVVKVGVGDGAEEGIGVEVIDFDVDVLA